MIKGAFPVAIVTSLLAALVPAVSLADEDPVAHFQTHIRPILEENCFRCHGPEKQKSDLRIDVLDPDLVKGKDGGKWHEILDVLDLGEMPPEDEEQHPDDGQRGAVIGWLESELKRAAVLRRSTGGKVTLRRLTRYEYNNTMRDLLGITLDYAKDLPPDTRGIDGYKNNGVFMGMSELQLEEYYRAAKRGLTSAIVQENPVEPIHITATEPAKGVRFDKLNTAPFDPKLNGTIVGFSQKESKNKKKKGASRKNAMVLLCLDKLPLTGTFRVKIKASSFNTDPKLARPRMRVEIGHKTGVGIEPGKLLAEHDITGTAESPQEFVFTGQLEEFPLHTGKTKKKFPGLRVIITDENAIPPKAPGRKKKGQPAPVPQPVAEDRPQLIIHSVEFETPVDGLWPPATHRRILPPREPETNDGDYIRTVLKNFISRAYRRPATRDEIDWAFRYYTKVRPTMNSFEETMREVLALVLVSPKFLYLPEFRSEKADSKKSPLNGYELASRLSYFFWGTMPDGELMGLAEQGNLENDAILATQVERMLADPRSWEFVKGFASQWLELDGVDAVAVNPEFFPKFESSLKENFKQEALHFFAEILREKMSCLNFLKSDFVMVNDRLADFYGIERPNSGEFQRVNLPPDSVRGGVLTQGNFLMGNSNGAQSHPIYRARWFLDRVMGTPPADPPADVPELDEEAATGKNLTLKQQLEAHRDRASCNRCHRKLDPWGIPFEEFNALGQFIAATPGSGKKAGKSRLIENETTLPDGTGIKGSRELVAYLLKNRTADFAEGFTRHLLTYALGRSLEWTDQPLIDQLSGDFASGGYKMDQLILNIVQSDAFKYK